MGTRLTLGSCHRPGTVTASGDNDRSRSSYPSAFLPAYRLVRVRLGSGIAAVTATKEIGEWWTRLLLDGLSRFNYRGDATEIAATPIDDGDQAIPARSPATPPPEQSP